MTLKIESFSDGNGTTIRLIGRMEEEHLDELKAEVEKAGPKIALDLEQLSLVDVEAVRRTTKEKTNVQETRRKDCSHYRRECGYRPRHGQAVRRGGRLRLHRRPP